jgi:tRNA uridine 5-carboxymethylaminomethyl modification enzyme
MAGINAALAAGGRERTFILSRSDAYIGVMIDDLVTRGVSEPYRMFTSRAEFRLKLRADNADQRLTPLGVEVGCIGADRAAVFTARLTSLAAGRNLLDRLTLTPNEASRAGLDINKDGRRRSAFELLAFPGVTLSRLAAIWPELDGLPLDAGRQLEIDARYAAYVQRQDEDVAVLKRDEAIAIPVGFDFGAIPSLSNEVRQKLMLHKPRTLAQAGRIDGMTPAALTLVLAAVKKAKTLPAPSDERTSA